MKKLYSIEDAPIAAKNRGVKVRFIYAHEPNAQYMDSLAAHEVQKWKQS